MLFDAWCRSPGDSATALPAAKLVSDWPHAGMATRSQTAALQSTHPGLVAARSFSPADLPKTATDDRASASSSLLSSQQHYSRNTASRQDSRGQQALRSSAAGTTSCRSSSSVRQYDDQETSSTATSADANETSASARTTAQHSATAETAAGHCAGVSINSPSSRLNDSPSHTSRGHREVGRTSSSNGGGASGSGSRGSSSSSRFRADAFSLRLCNSGAAWDAVQVPLPLIPTLPTCRHASDVLELAEAIARPGVPAAAESSGSERRVSAAAQLAAGTRAQALLRRSLSTAASSPPLALQPVIIPRSPSPAPASHI